MRNDLMKRLSERRATPSAGVGPKSYNKKNRTADFVISTGAAVERAFGTERLDVSGVDLQRMEAAGIPLLDSHQQQGIDNHLGTFTRIWREQGNRLVGRVAFNDTPRGRAAEGMVARGEIKGISAGYIVREWEITDEDGRILDLEHDRLPLDGSLTFTAKRWELLEASLVSVPADAASYVRSLNCLKSYQRNALARMEARMRMMARSRMIARMVRSSTPISKATRRMLLRRQIADHRTLHGY
jgi:phage head maturation protease